MESELERKEIQMGHREDLVRQRLADEERRRREKAEMKARTEEAELVQLNQEYDELIAAFDKEGKRIAKLLEHADWSRAELRKFTYPKKHRWSRKRTMEFACFKFARGLNGLSGWMRSDDRLYLGDRRGWLHRPSSCFERPTAGDTRRNATIHEMRETLDALKAYEIAAVA